MAENYQKWQERLLHDLDAAVKQKRKIIYVDEVCFTKLALLRKAYSHRFTNLAVNQIDVYTGYHCAAVAVSKEKGLEHALISDSAINQTDFIGFVKDIQRKNRGLKLALFMDNLAVHKGKDVKPFYTKLNITPLYNIPYSPATNPIESCFSVVKSHFKRRRLGCLVDDRPFNAPQHISECL